MDKSRRISRSYKTLHIGTGVRVQGCHIMIFTPFKTDLAWYTPQRFIAQGLGSSGHWTVWPRVFESWNLELPWYTYSFQKFYEILLAISFQKCEGKHDIQLVVVCSKMSLESRTNACFFESVSSHPRTTSRNPSANWKYAVNFRNARMTPPKRTTYTLIPPNASCWTFLDMLINSGRSFFSSSATPEKTNNKTPSWQWPRYIVQHEENGTSTTVRAMWYFFVWWTRAPLWPWQSEHLNWANKHWYNWW